MLIATWNVNSLNVRLPHVLAWLERNKPDVLCLQETKLTDDKFPRAELEEAGYHCQFFGQKAYNGVAIISASEPSSARKGFPDDTESDAKRLIECKFGDLTVLNVYVPNGQAVGSEKFHYKLDWIACLRQYLDACHKPDQMLVVCGDFNIALEDRDVYDPAAMSGQILFSAEEKAALQTLSQWGLVDTFRLHHEEGGLYTWWDYRMMAFRRKMGLRIDYIWASKALSELCTRSWVDVEPRKLDKPSDHAPVLSEFKLNQ